MKRLLILGGTLIEPGEIREVHLPITEAANSRPVLLPITVIRGRNEGLCVLLTAAVHGDELNGTAILRELLEVITDVELFGSLIIVPIVNILGFLSRSRYLPDRRDLNRFFPGSPTGNMTERVAHRFFENVCKMADVILDFHTAGHGRENYPHIRADMENPLVRKYAKTFGTPIILDDKGAKGTLRRAATDHGIPAIVFEGGTADTFQKSIVKAGVSGLLRFLERTGMIKKEKTKKKFPFHVVVKRTQWIRAERGGILELKIHPGNLLYRGDPVAQISNPLGKEVHLLPSPHTGLVIGVTTSPVVNPGMPVAHVAQLQKTLSTIERAISSKTLKPLKL